MCVCRPLCTLPSLADRLFKIRRETSRAAYFWSRPIRATSASGMSTTCMPCMPCAPNTNTIQAQFLVREN